MNKKPSKTATAAKVKSDVVYEKLGDIEKHGRLNSIRVYGLKDNTNETEYLTAEALVHLCRTKLNVDEIKKQDIDIVYRLGS